MTAGLLRRAATGRALLRLLVALGVSTAMPGLSVADDEPPDIDFLEYLGSWEESDDEWLLFSDEAEADESSSDAEESADEVAAMDKTELNNER